jgi:hypothetical protein
MLPWPRSKGIAKKRVVAGRSAGGDDAAHPQGAAALAQLAGSAAGLPALASAFSRLGLKPELVSKAIPVVVSYVTKTGGAGIAGLLAGALK